MVWGSGRLASRSIRNICFSLAIRQLSGQPELILVGDVAIAEKSAFASAVVEDRQQRAQEKGKREVLELGGHFLLCFLSLARFASIVVAAPGFGAVSSGIGCSEGLSIRGGRDTLRAKLRLKMPQADLYHLCANSGPETNQHPIQLAIGSTRDPTPRSRSPRVRRKKEGTNRHTQTEGTTRAYATIFSSIFSPAACSARFVRRPG